MAKHSPSKLPPSTSLATHPVVIVCDDHIAIRAGLRQILESQEISVAGECQSLEELRSLVKVHPKAVLVTDLGVDNVAFATLLGAVRQQSLGMPIVVYSMRETPATIGLCYQTGAMAFVPKSSDVSELIKAVDAAASGKIYFPPGVASDLAAMHTDPNHPKIMLLPRELEIFKAYVTNADVSQIASDLGVTTKRVQNTLSVVAHKLNVPRSQFRNVALRHGLVDEG